MQKGSLQIFKYQFLILCKIWERKKNKEKQGWQHP